MFNSPQAINIANKLRYKKQPKSIQKDNWKKIKEQYYPSSPVIQGGEMPHELLYPYGKPDSAGRYPSWPSYKSQDIGEFEFTEKESMRYVHEGTNMWHRERKIRDNQ